MYFFLFIRRLWSVGNYWARLAIIIVASWPLIIALTALIGWPALTVTVALLPLIAVVFGLIGLNPRHPRRRLRGQPLVIAAIGAVWPRFLRTLALIIGTELAIGAYFAAVPVANDRGLIPLALLLLLAIIFLALSGWRGRVMSALVVVFIVLTAIFLLGGREKTKERARRAVEWVKPKPPAPVRTSRILEVDRQWLTVPLPEYQEFDFLPLDAPILIRRVDGETFERRPDGTLLHILRGGRREVVTDIGRPIPGYSLDLSATGHSRVVFSMWPTRR
jgi:hypothetical protein